MKTAKRIVILAVVAIAICGCAPTVRTETGTVMTRDLVSASLGSTDYNVGVQFDGGSFWVKSWRSLYYGTEVGDCVSIEFTNVWNEWWPTAFEVLPADDAAR
jgi:hypothetical protein